jgi:hypothetical protein
VAAPPRNQLSPISLAMAWVSRILAVVAEMVLPGLAGNWLDTRWGTKFLALVGFALGTCLGVYHLLVITRAQNARRMLGSTRGVSGRDTGVDRDADPDRK